MQVGLGPELDAAAASGPVVCVEAVKGLEQLLLQRQALGLHRGRQKLRVPTATTTRGRSRRQVEKKSEREGGGTVTLRQSKIIEKEGLRRGSPSQPSAPSKGGAKSARVTGGALCSPDAARLVDVEGLKKTLNLLVGDLVPVEHLLAHAVQTK